MNVRGIFTALAIGILSAASLAADEMPYQLDAKPLSAGLSAGQFDSQKIVNPAVSLSGYTHNNSQGAAVPVLRDRDSSRPGRRPPGPPAGVVTGKDLKPGPAEAAVPEPSTVLLLLSGVVGIVAARRKFSRA